MWTVLRNLKQAYKQITHKLFNTALPIVCSKIFQMLCCRTKHPVRLQAAHLHG